MDFKFKMLLENLQNSVKYYVQFKNIMIVILIFFIFVPHLDGYSLGQKCVYEDKQGEIIGKIKNFASTLFSDEERVTFFPQQTFQYESFHDYVTFKAYMKYWECNENFIPKIEERRRNFIQVFSGDERIQSDSISRIGEIWKIPLLRPCQTYTLETKYSVDIVQPDFQKDILPLTHQDVKISTAPVLHIQNVKIESTQITFTFKDDRVFKWYDYYANIFQNWQLVQNKTMYGQTISFSGLESGTEYEFIVKASKLTKTDSTTDIFVVFPKIFYHKFKTLSSTDEISQIERSKTSVKTTGIKTFNNVSACEDFKFTVKCQTIISHRLTKCPCPEQKNLKLKKTMTYSTIQITWPSVERRGEFLCGVQDYVVYVQDLERTRSPNNYYELPFCHSLDVKIVALSYENLVVAEGALNITEFHKETLKKPKLHFEFNTKFRPIFTPIIDEKYKWCNFTVTQKISAVDTLNPCILNNITLETTLNGNKLDPMLITIETPIQEIKISDVDSSPIVKFCSEYSKFLTYHLKVTWIEFVAESNCDEEVPQEKDKVYNSTGFDLKLDELIPNSKYNLILEVFHKGYDELVFASQKIIETSQLDVHKIRDVKINVEYQFEETCEANIKLTWTKPCTKDVKNYQVVFGLEENANIISEYMTKNEFVQFSDQNCSTTYKICITAENYKESEHCEIVNALPKPNLNFDKIFIRESSKTFYINENVIQQNRDVIQHARVELIDKNCSEGCVFNFSKTSWNPFKRGSTDKIRFTVGPHSIPKSDVKNYEIIPLKAESNIIRLILKNELGEASYSVNAIVEEENLEKFIAMVLGEIQIVLLLVLICIARHRILNSCSSLGLCQCLYDDVE